MTSGKRSGSPKDTPPDDMGQGVSPSDDGPALLNRAQAAALLRVHPRTIARWRKEGFIAPNGEGLYSREELKALRDSPNAPDELRESGDFYEHMAAGVGMSHGHAERLLSLIERPMSVATKGLMKMNRQLMRRVKASDAQYLKMMATYGELLMNKEEREILREREAVKSGLMAQGGEQLLQMLPMLLMQLMGSKAGASGMAAAGDFLSSLTPEQGQQLAGMAAMFEGEQREKFERMMAELGRAPAPAEAN